MQTLAQLYGREQFSPEPEHPRLITTDRVGIEIELEGVSPSEYRQLGEAVSRYWDVKEDGSLRNGGIEIVSRGGQGGTTLISAFNLLESALSTVDFNASWRCSTHIHVNMLDATMKQCAMLVMAYTCVEPILFHFCSENRQANNFCIQNKDCLSSVKTSMYAFHTCSTGSNNCTIEKYMALNLLPLFHHDFGTVEFRGSHAITTKDELIGLTNRMLAVKRLVMQWTGDEEGLINHIEVNGWRHVFQGVIPEGMECCTNDEFEAAVMRAWSLLKSYLGWDSKIKKQKQIESELVNASYNNSQSLTRPSARPTTQYASWVDISSNPQPLNSGLPNNYNNFAGAILRTGLRTVSDAIVQVTRTTDNQYLNSLSALLITSRRGLAHRYEDLYALRLTMPIYMHYMDRQSIDEYHIRNLDYTVQESLRVIQKFNIRNQQSVNVGRVLLRENMSGILTNIKNWLVSMGYGSDRAARASMAQFWSAGTSPIRGVSLKNRTNLQDITSEFGYNSNMRSLSFLSAYWMFKKYGLFDQSERFVMSQCRPQFQMFCNILDKLADHCYAIPSTTGGFILFNNIVARYGEYLYTINNLTGDQTVVQHRITNEGTN